jgi:hypothetical protein
MADAIQGATLWYIDDQSLSKALKKLEKAGIDINQIQIETNTPSSTLQVFRPSEKLIQSMLPSTRKKLRDLLKKQPKNVYFTYPVIIETNHPKTWFLQAGLLPETVDLITSLCYQEGELTLFSDVTYVFSKIKSPEEQERFLGATTRTRALAVRLRITEQTDLLTLKDYWTLNNRRKEILPILQAITETPMVETLDITHLLPPSARLRLYTFPLSSSDSENCHSTCMEFNGVQLIGVTPKTADWESIFNSVTIPATGDLQLGDIIVLKDKRDEYPIHSAVYIAADIVFTKNGVSPNCPWVLMLWQDVVDLYELDTPLTTHVYRAID